MKLLRYGNIGEENPALLDGNGRLRDLSAVVPDIAGKTLLPDGLDRIRAVDPATLPSALEWFVDINPISHLVTASRGLMDGTAIGDSLLVVLPTAVVLTAVFAPLTAKLYRRS